MPDLKRLAAHVRSSDGLLTTQRRRDGAHASIAHDQMQVMVIKVPSAVARCLINSGSRQRDPAVCMMDVYDVIIVGAGPCGLAVAARLRESAPAALFTDEEHRRYQWIRRHGRKMSIKHVKNGRVSAAAPPPGDPQYSMLVLDAEHDRWMGRWDRLFGTYGISHLRSHMLWHVDPQDRDSLLAQAYLEGREGELTEMKGCVGKEISKHLHKKRGRYIGARATASTTTA
ncbi:hypothetical protein VTK73DRAFT_243 [Phialemonium thermophilum]|uniref:FAD-binding domain-containing protein n=1 Tax=Phialemonium thermophilum TaxID=223376 RepID=A0ABR3VW75_9PEZI